MGISRDNRKPTLRLKGFSRLPDRLRCVSYLQQRYWKEKGIRLGKRRLRRQIATVRGYLR